VWLDNAREDEVVVTLTIPGGTYYGRVIDVHDGWVTLGDSPYGGDQCDLRIDAIVRRHRP
jgi:hypothetical protein